MKNIRNYIFLLAAGLPAVLSSSCRFQCVKGSGHLVSETRKITDFKKIDITGGDFKINLKQDSSLTLTISGDDNLLKYIKTSVHGDELRIHDHKNICSDNPITVNIGVRDLQAVESSGGVEINGDGKLNVKDIAFHLNGAAKVTLNLNAANVTTDGGGTVEMDLTGQATSHTVDISGSAHLDALNFVVGTYDITTTGAADCQINVLQTLNVHSTGASNIKYRGNPGTVNNDKTGAGSLTKIN